MKVLFFFFNLSCYYNINNLHYHYCFVGMPFDIGDMRASLSKRKANPDDGSDLPPAIKKQVLDQTRSKDKAFLVSFSLPSTFCDRLKGFKSIWWDNDGSVRRCFLLKFSFLT